MSIDRLVIYKDGVVCDRDASEAKIISTIKNDIVYKQSLNLSAFEEIWGYWYPGQYREIELQLDESSVLNGIIDEFNSNTHKMISRRKSLNTYFANLFYYFNAAHAHLRILLLNYARLTSILGPELPFQSSPVISINDRDVFACFDSFLISMRSFADSMRYVCWRTLEKREQLPRSFIKLVSSDIPLDLKKSLTSYWKNSMAELAEYRDNSVHYQSPGSHILPLLLHSSGVIHAQVWIPFNPQVRSLKKFKYKQIDAYSYARKKLLDSYSFINDFFKILEYHQRRIIRQKKRSKK